MLSTIDLFRDKWDIYLISCFFSQYPTWKMGTFSIAWICSIWMCISDNDVQCWSQPSEASLDAKNIGMWTRFPWSQRLVGLVPGHWEVYIVAWKLFIRGKFDWILKEYSWKSAQMYRHGNTVQGDFYRACSINQLLLSITFDRHFSEKTIPILKKMQKIPLTAFTFNIRDRSPLSSVLSWENLLSNLGPKAAVVTLVFGKITNITRVHINLGWKHQLTWMPLNNLWVDFVALAHLFLLEALKTTISHCV